MGYEKLECGHAAAVIALPEAINFGCGVHWLASALNAWCGPDAAGRRRVRRRSEILLPSPVRERVALIDDASFLLADHYGRYIAVVECPQSG